MLKMLRYDFYKIFKSKALLGVFIASVCLAFLDSIFVGLYYQDTSVYRLLASTILVRFLPVVFVAPFACKDFSSKFLNNVFSEYSLGDKICYVLSKAVCIFAVYVIWYTVYFLSSCAFVFLDSCIKNVPFRFEMVSLDGTFMASASEGMFMYFCVFLNAFALGMVVLFLSLLTKREYVVAVVYILYLFALSPYIYNAINTARGDPHGWNDMFHAVEWYTVFGMHNFLCNSWGSDTTGTAELIAAYKQSTLISTGYAVLFCILSVLFASKKKC